MNTNDYEISEMETTTSRGGKGKGKKTSEAGLKRYTPKETMVLARCYIDVFEDPVIRNNQKFQIFWGRVTEKYNAQRPRGSVERAYEMLRKHWSRFQKDVQKWSGLYANAQKMWSSGHSLADIAKKANRVERPFVGKVSCTLCGKDDHATSYCKVEEREEILHTNATGVWHHKGPKKDPFAPTHNPGWRDHPNFRWTDPNQPQAVVPQPVQPPVHYGQNHGGQHFNRPPFQRGPPPCFQPPNPGGVPN